MSHGHAGAPGRIGAFVVTASSTRGPGDDASGSRVAEALERAGVDVAGRRIVDDDVEALRSAVRSALAAGSRLVVVTGGTGLSPRDRTPEALAAIYDRPIEGFGELFRMLSFAEVGAAAMLSRATGGVVGNAAVFGVPGSPGGASLAVERLIAPEIRHLLGQLDRVEAPRPLPPVPPSLAALAPAAALLTSAPHKEVRVEDGRTMVVYAWPDGRAGKALHVGPDRDGWPDVRAAHRRRAHTVVDDSIHAADVTGRPCPIEGPVIAVDGARVWVRAGDRAHAWDGRRLVEHGTLAQLLVSLLTDWHAR